MMIPSCCRFSPRLLVWSGLTLVYFVLYPQDLLTLLAPVESMSIVTTRLLGVTTSVSVWLYVLASVCVMSWTAIAITDRIVAKNQKD